jgi:hypothetical protein
MEIPSQPLLATKLEKDTDDVTHHDNHRNFYNLLDIQSKTSLFRGTIILVVSTIEGHLARQKHHGRGATSRHKIKQDKIR